MKRFKSLMILITSILFFGGCLNQEKVILYHGSSILGLREIQPSLSTHQKKWVYATKEPWLAVLFIVKKNNFDMAIGNEDKQVGVYHLVERYKGAFDLFKNKKGSLYHIDGSGFEKKTSFKGEFVSKEPALVIKEIIIEDVWRYIIGVSKSGKIKLYYYPDRPKSIPHDDGDLIEIAAQWMEQISPGIKEEFVRKHPHLKDRLDEHVSSLKGKDGLSNKK